MTATHMAFCKLIQDRSFSSRNFLLEHGFSINAQRHSEPKPPEEYLGQFAVACYLKMPYTVEESDFWTLAQEATKRIHGELSEETYVEENIAVLDSFNTEEFLNEILSPSDRQELVRLSSCNFVSSGGSFDFGEEQEQYTYNLHECFYTSLGHGFASTFNHFNATVNGKMWWVILYDPAKVTNDEQAETFSNLCFNYFLEIDH